MGAGKWNWSTSIDGNDDSGVGYLAEGGEWNFYTTTINGIAYNVYVVTYETALATGAETPYAMDQVYLDGKVTNEDITKIKTTLGNEWKIEIAAEGTQAAGFENAFEALNEAFGVPSTSNNPFN